jgi:DNA-directed RNA polymerase subunit F
MKKEYDFSKGTRGKFYHRNVTLNLPIYLNSENLAFVEKIAKKKNKDLNAVVNELIKTDQTLAKKIG